VTEGGYDLPALGQCLDAALGVLFGGETAPIVDAASATGRADAAISAVRRARSGLRPAL
jgi:hypothetical protein